MITESDLVLKHIKCKKTGIEAICIFSPESECCKDIPRETIDFEGGQLVKHGNSALLSLKLSFNDVVEEFIFERISTELVRNPSSLIKPLREPEEGYHITFFLDEEMVKEKEQREKIIKYIEEFPTKMRRVVTDSKMTINTMVRRHASNFRID